MVFGGLPGVGKTTVAASVARHTGANFVRIDAVETGINLAGLTPHEGLGASGYRVANQLVRSMLFEEMDVIVDAVNPVREARQGWVDLAAELDTEVLQVEVICSDIDRHRRQIEHRAADLPGHAMPTWGEVRELVYEPWPEADVVVGSIDPGNSIDRIMARLHRPRPLLNP